MGFFYKEACCRVQNEGLGDDALFSRHGGVAECRWNFLGTREVCSRDLEEVQDDGLQGHDHTYGIDPKLLNNASLESVDATMYHQIIGSLMYLTNMRPNIFFAMNTLSQFLTDPRHVHLIDAKHILRYLKGTIDYGLKYKTDQNINLEGYVDSYWEGSAIDR